MNLQAGDVIRCHRVRVELYLNNVQLIGSPKNGCSFVAFHRKVSCITGLAPLSADVDVERIDIDEVEDSRRGERNGSSSRSRRRERVEDDEGEKESDDEDDEDDEETCSRRAYSISTSSSKPSSSSSFFTSSSSSEGSPNKRRMVRLSQSSSFQQGTQGGRSQYEESPSKRPQSQAFRSQSSSSQPSESQPITSQRGSSSSSGGSSSSSSSSSSHGVSDNRNVNTDTDNGHNALRTDRGSNHITHSLIHPGLSSEEWEVQHTSAAFSFDAIRDTETVNRLYAWGVGMFLKFPLGEINQTLLELKNQVCQDSSDSAFEGGSFEGRNGTNRRSDNILTGTSSGDSARSCVSCRNNTCMSCGVRGCMSGSVRDGRAIVSRGSSGVSGTDGAGSGGDMREGMREGMRESSSSSGRGNVTLDPFTADILCMVVAVVKHSPLLSLPLNYQESGMFFQFVFLLFFRCVLVCD